MDFVGLTRGRVEQEFSGFESPALVVGHPGHELRVFGWFQAFTPTLHVITDGSGRGGPSRSETSARLAQQSGAGRGAVFGQHSDAEIYTALLDGDRELFKGLLRRLLSALLADEVDLVAGDAAEGYNPTHDLCRALIDAAVISAWRKHRLAIANYEFALADWAAEQPPTHDARCAHFRISGEKLRAKRQACADYIELAAEVETLTGRLGGEVFTFECLKQVLKPCPDVPGTARPGYEVLGERLVREGVHHRVVRHDQHVAPVIRTLYDEAFGEDEPDAIRAAYRRALSSARDARGARSEERLRATLSRA
jgi:hypothetical protein